MKNPQVNALKRTPGTPIGTRIVAGAAILLLQANMAFAFQSESASAPAQTAPLATGTLQTAPTVPFNEMLHHSHNPFDAYRGKIVPPPSMANSLRLTSLVRDGKLYLSLRNAIDLALENNLDLVIARYNLPIAQMDILRTQAGGFTRGVNTGVVSGTPGGAASGTGTGSGAGGTSTGSGGAGAGSGGLVQSTFGVGTNVSSFDPYIIAKVYNDHTSQVVPNQTVLGVPVAASEREPCKHQLSTVLSNRHIL